MSDKKLSLKQAKFSREWALTGNKSKAYRAAYDCKGWKEASINTEAWKLSKHPEILRRYNQLQKNAADLVGITKGRQLTELIKIAYAKLDHETVSVSDKRAAIAEINKMLNYYDADPADDTLKEPPKKLIIEVINQKPLEEIK